MSRPVDFRARPVDFRAHPVDFRAHPVDFRAGLSASLESLAIDLTRKASSRYGKNARVISARADQKVAF